MGISNGCINSVEFWKSNMAFFLVAMFVGHALLKSFSGVCCT